MTPLPHSLTHALMLCAEARHGTCHAPKRELRVLARRGLVARVRCRLGWGQKETYAPTFRGRRYLLACHEAWRRRAAAPCPAAASEGGEAALPVRSRLFSPVSDRPPDTPNTAE